MDFIRQSLVVGILLASCLALALGVDTKETTQSSPMAIPTPKQDRNNLDLVDSLQGYRITGVTPHACAQIGGIFILYDCILLTPAAKKPARPRNTQLDE